MNTQHFPPQFLLQLAERAVAQALRYDPKARTGMAAMAGKVIAVELLGPEVTLYAFPREEGIQLRSEHAGSAHVRIRGTPLALLAMAVNRDKRPSTFTGEVEFVGDLALGQHIQSVLASLDVDWEELLSAYVGDLAAHKLGNLARSATRWLGQTRRILEMDMGEYLRIEARILLEPRDLRNFVTAVDSLRMDADRLEARLARLERLV